MQPYFCEKYGNPSGIYKMASECRQALETVRKQIGETLKVSAEEIGIHYNTFYGTIEELCKGENPLLIKSNIIHRSSKNSPICSPRVIVINKVGWKKELQGAVSILKNNPGWESELLAANALL